MPKRRFPRTGLLGVFASSLLALSCRSSPDAPIVMDDLPNPGRGWYTLMSIASDPVNNDYPISRIAYYRFTWRQAEPHEGQYDFADLDSLVAKARSAGQRFAFRIMPDTVKGGRGVPDWLYDKGIKGWAYAGADGSSCFSPDAGDPTYMDYAQKLIAAFGAHYALDPDIEFVDIGMVGDYGEWHYTAGAANGAVMPSLAVREQYIDWFLRYFPGVHLEMLVGDLTATDALALAYAISKGTGWRADAWGDFRPGYNHMENDYPIKLTATIGADTAWRISPVVLESGGTLEDWFENFPGRIDDALAFAVDRHVSIVAGQGSIIPDPWKEKIAAFTSKIGYRLTLASTPVLPASVGRGAALGFALTWRNLGNAPPYRRYVLTTRLMAGGVELSRSVAGADPRTWMPRSADGLDYVTDLSVDVPPAAPVGTAIVEIALIDPASGEPAVRLALGGRRDGLWYDLGSVSLD